MARVNRLIDAYQGAFAEYPFGPEARVYKVMGKMFALSGLERLPTQVNLKCEPERAIALREQYDGDIIPGYHMSKVHWNTLMLQSLPPKLILELVDHSYELVVSKFTKKLKAEFDSLA